MAQYFALDFFGSISLLLISFRFVSQLLLCAIMTGALNNSALSNDESEGVLYTSNRKLVHEFSQSKGRFKECSKMEVFHKLEPLVDFAWIQYVQEVYGVNESQAALVNPRSLDMLYSKTSVDIVISDLGITDFPVTTGGSKLWFIAGHQRHFITVDQFTEFFFPHDHAQNWPTDKLLSNPKGVDFFDYIKPYFRPLNSLDYYTARYLHIQHRLDQPDIIRDHQWVEVMRSSTDCYSKFFHLPNYVEGWGTGYAIPKGKTKKVPYGCWFFITSGSGVFVNTGKTLVINAGRASYDHMIKFLEVEGSVGDDEYCLGAQKKGYDSIQLEYGDKPQLVICAGAKITLLIVFYV